MRQQVSVWVPLPELWPQPLDNSLALGIVGFTSFSNHGPGLPVVQCPEHCFTYFFSDLFMAGGQLLSQFIFQGRSRAYCMHMSMNKADSFSLRN